jgi:hypothetical protein
VTTLDLVGMKSSTNFLLLRGKRLARFPDTDIFRRRHIISISTTSSSS